MLSELGSSDAANQLIELATELRDLAPFGTEIASGRVCQTRFSGVPNAASQISAARL